MAAHSMVRALYSSFDGALYEVTRASDKATKAIPLLAAGGYADSAVQDEFCAGATCNVSLIFDQSGRGNHLGVYRRPDLSGGDLKSGTPTQDQGVNASRDKHVVGEIDHSGAACHSQDLGCWLALYKPRSALKLLSCDHAGGHPVYSAYFETGAGYRNVQSMPHVPPPPPPNLSGRGCGLEASLSQVQCSGLKRDAANITSAAACEAACCAAGAACILWQFCAEGAACAAAPHNDAGCWRGSDASNCRLDDDTGWVGAGRWSAAKPLPANGTAVGDEPESMYMVTSGKHFNNHCCFGGCAVSACLLPPTRP